MGPYQPELRVVVDTTIPRIDQLRAVPVENGAIDIECRATDVNLDPANLKIETQRDATSPWLLAALQPMGSGDFGVIQIRCQPIGGVRPGAVRATIADKAGNTTVYQTPVAAGSAIAGPQLTQPVLARRRRTHSRIGLRWAGRSMAVPSTASAVDIASAGRQPARTAVAGGAEWPMRLCGCGRAARRRRMMG